MILAAKGARLFDAENIDGALDDTEERRIAPGIGANRARVLLGKTAADRAKTDTLPRRDNRLGQMLDRSGFGLNDMERDALGRARADARECGEGGHQRGAWFRKRGRESRMVSGGGMD